MDWKKTFNRGQWAIHGFFTIIIILAVGITLFSLRIYQLQNSEEERILKANSIIQFLKQDQSFDKIEKNLMRAEADKANDKLKDLSSKMAELEDILLVKANDDLGKSINAFKTTISKSSEMARPDDALRVLKKKVNSIYEFAKTRSYKKVSIITERMGSRLAQLNANNAGGSVLISYLVSDLARLTQIVKSSTLRETEKQSLLEKINSMQVEVGLLSNLTSNSKSFQGLVKDASLSLGQWLIETEKLTEGIKGQKISNQRNLVMMLSGFVSFVFLGWIGLAYLFRWQKNNMDEQVEKEVKLVVQKGIIEDQRYMVDHYSEGMREDIIRLLDSLKVKLSLGNLLHEGLPFAGCMIDSQFKLAWNNQLFLEQLYLSEEEVQSESFNWDYVREYLNLDQDPIYEAMVNKIAGIYPIRVKQDEFTPSQPFEMYVTPISTNREDRVMVFFYPLISAKEAIAEQVSMSRASIERFIDLWNKDELSKDELSLMEKNFKNLDLESLFFNLKNIFLNQSEEKREYLLTINELEKSVEHLTEVLDKMDKVEEDRIARAKDEAKVVQDLRGSFVSSVEKCDTLLQINKSIMLQNDDLKNNAQRLWQQNLMSQKLSKETCEILSGMELIKVDYRKLKMELLEVKAKLISLNNSLFAHLPPLDENQQKLALRHKDELARLDFNVVTLDKKLSQLDTLVGKLQMMYDKKEMEQISFNFSTSQKEHELKETITEIQRAIGVDETRIINQFKHLHELFKEDVIKAGLNHHSENQLRN